jgi:hypothetical protein
MPQLKWNEADFAACLEVLPTIDEYATGHHYKVEKDGLRLELSVYQYDSDIMISLYQLDNSRPLINFTITDCSGTRYVNDERGEYLEFAPSQVFGTRYERDQVIPAGVRLSVKPSISLELFA